MEHGPTGEGGAVLDRLYHGDGSPYIKERIRLIPQEQLVSFLHPWFPPQLQPEVTHKAPQAAHVAPPLAPVTTLR